MYKLVVLFLLGKYCVINSFSESSHFKFVLGGIYETKFSMDYGDGF
ncbi:hypothetical protein THIOSC15_1820002 [uncultured Thiomicrorhabdus sp.]